MNREDRRKLFIREMLCQLFIIFLVGFVISQNHTCGGEEYDSQVVCNAHGDCVAQNICECSSVNYYGKTCEFNKDLGEWKNLGKTPSGENRFNHAGIYITGRDDFIIHGGFNKELKIAFNDMWELDLSDGDSEHEWTFLSGTDEENSAPVYSQSFARFNESNPGSRYNHVCLQLSTNLMLLTFGRSINSKTMKSDMWEFDLELKQWKHVHGSNGKNVKGVYNSSDFSPFNVIGSRRDHQVVAFEDQILIFGGDGYDALGYDTHSTTSMLSDLWIIDFDYNVKWHSIPETKFANKLGIYGSKKVYAPNVHPGGRRNFAAFKKSATEMGIFGGDGCDVDQCNDVDHLNDFWVFNTETMLWGWIGGSMHNDVKIQYPPALNQWKLYPGNYSSWEWHPGGRRNFYSSIINSNEFLLFGGQGQTEFDSKEFYNDVWIYHFDHDQWKFMGGSFHGGVEYFFSPDIYPVRRCSGASDYTEDGKFVIHGGREMQYEHTDPAQKDKTGGDLWIYTIPTHFFCGGIQSTDDNLEKMCSGHGTCFQDNMCACDAGWEGDLCEEKYVRKFGEQDVATIIFICCGVLFVFFVIFVAAFYVVYKIYTKKQLAGSADRALNSEDEFGKEMTIDMSENVFVEKDGDEDKVLV